MIGPRIVLYTLMIAAPILIAGGCVKRKEKITIGRDGAVTVAIDYEGDLGDFDKGDAMPSPASGWKVEREVKAEVTQEGERKDEIKLTGERTFKAGEELPGSYAAANAADAGLYLKFPTTLTRERRKDGVYLHFRRVYMARDWAYVQYWSDQHIDDNIKKIGDKNTEELTPDERVEIIRAFLGVEAYKQVELAQRALRECDDKLKQDHWLLARRAMLNVYEEGIDWDAMAKRVENLSPGDRDGQFERESQRLVDEAHRALVRSLKNDAGYDGERIEKFEAALERARRYHEITNLLSGHAFEIEVIMPGTIVAHNGDKADADDGTVEWEFDGTVVRDRPYELLVTSRLPLDRDEK